MVDRQTDRHCSPMNRAASVSNRSPPGWLTTHKEERVGFHVDTCIGKAVKVVMCCRWFKVFGSASLPDFVLHLVSMETNNATCHLKQRKWLQFGESRDKADKERERNHVHLACMHHACIKSTTPNDSFVKTTRCMAVAVFNLLIRSWLFIKRLCSDTELEQMNPKISTDIHICAPCI